MNGRDKSKDAEQSPDPKKETTNQETTASPKTTAEAPSASGIKKDDITVTDARVFMPLGNTTQDFGVKKAVSVEEKRRDEFFEQAPSLFSLLRRKPASPLAEEGSHNGPGQRAHKGEYFITPETLALLLYRDFQKYNARARVGEDKHTVNTERVFEIDNNPEKLCQLLSSLNLQNGEDLKLIFIQDSHAVACYLRNDNGRMRCYIGDSIGNTPSTARNLARYFHACLNNPEVIIGPSLQAPFDFYSCYTFAKKSNLYYMKHGSEIFSHIDKVGTTPDPKIPNCQTISAEKLMPALLKLCQLNLQFTDEALDTVVSQSKGKTLRHYHTEHKKEMGLTVKDEEFGPYNTAAVVKRYKYFHELNEELKKLGIQEISTDPNAPLPEPLLDRIKDFYTPPKETNFVNICLEIVAFMDSKGTELSPLARAYLNYIEKKIPHFSSWYHECAAQFAATDHGDLQKLLLISLSANYFDDTKVKILSDLTKNTEALLQMHSNQPTVAIEHLKQERLLSPEAMGGSINNRFEAHKKAAAASSNKADGR